MCTNRVRTTGGGLNIRLELTDTLNLLNLAGDYKTKYM